jgi:hypothetical protein
MVSSRKSLCQNERLKISNEDLELRAKQANQIAEQAREVANVLLDGNASLIHYPATRVADNT